MTKKQIKQLASASYTKEILDSKKVEKIAALLSRADVKEYIRALKLAEKSHTVSLVLPDAKLYNSNRKFWENAFKNKRVIVEEDPSLLLGVKVINNDMIYDMTLKNNLELFAKETAE